MAHTHDQESPENDSAPGEDTEHPDAVTGGIRGYVVGLVLALMLTGASFYVVHSNLIYPAGIPVALVALAIAQMGVHLVFFLHITTGPDNSNNALALAFGVLIVGLVLIGTLWIMAHLNHNMMPPGMMLQMQR